MKNRTRIMALISGAALSGLAAPTFSTMNKAEEIRSEPTVERYLEVYHELKGIDGYEIASDRSPDHLVALRGELQTFNSKPYVTGKLSELEETDKNAALYFAGSLLGGFLLGSGIALTIRNRR